MTATDWDTQARTLDEARQAVWAEDDQAAGLDHCLTMLTSITDLLATVDDAQILDLGVGIGRLAIPLAQAHPTATIWGLDASHAMLTHLLDRCIHDDIRNVRVMPGDGTTIPDEIPPLDGAYSVVTLQHLPVDQQASYVRQVIDRLRPGGVFRFQVVTNTGRGPLSNPVSGAQVASWCTGDLDHLAIYLDARFPTWRWVTVTKR